MIEFTSALEFTFSSQLFFSFYGKVSGADVTHASQIRPCLELPISRQPYGRISGDPVCRSLVIRREPMEESILELVHQYVASLLEKRKKVSSKSQCEYKEINIAELQKQSRQLSSEKMKLYDDYKDGRMDRDLYKQRAKKISGQLEEIRQKIEDTENNKKLLEQDELSDKIKLEDFLELEKFDTEKLREIIKVIRVHS